MDQQIFNEVILLSTGLSTPLKKLSITRNHHELDMLGTLSDNNKAYHECSNESSITSSNNSDALSLVFGHGLGSSNPKLKSHLTDSWSNMIEETLLKMNTNQDTDVRINDIHSVSYTARGHGESHGWEETCESNPEQFKWKNLCHDMVAVAEYYTFPSFIAAGSSMGSATALYASMKYPTKVKAVIMIRPPTAWDKRIERRKYLLNSMKKVSAIDVLNNEKFSFVLKGAAFSDFPDPINEIEVYKNIICPVMILTIEGDEAHPVSTAVILNELISTSTLHISNNKEDAMKDWPTLIYDFLSKLS